MKKNMFNKNIVINRKINYEYFILKRMEAGLVLEPWEVKALKFNQVSIINSYVSFISNEAYLVNATITPIKSTFLYKKCNIKRNRKLLLNKKELHILLSHINRLHCTAVALSIYWKKKWCKIEIGIVKGKKQYDKRLDIKKREWNIDKERFIKNFF
ncbi:MAG: SsrA-binding protein SmpB [Arsenophonus sp.]|nr:MAG: SsrA-binding protein SmpB [Arsenophonus sp.]